MQPETAPASVPTATPLGSCRGAAGTQSSHCLPGGSEEETGAAALPLGPGRGAASAQASRDTRGDDAEAAGAAALPRGLSRGAADAQAPRCGGPDEEFVYELELFKMLAVEVATLEELDDEDAATFVKMVVEAQNEVLGCSDSEGAILRRPVAELCATLAGLRRRGWASQRRPPGGRR